MVVVGFDRQARPDERVLAGLFILAAIVVSVLGLPVRGRLREVAERLVPGPSVRPSRRSTTSAPA